jgi:hypothetical protein
MIVKFLLNVCISDYTGALHNYISQSILTVIFKVFILK